MYRNRMLLEIAFFVLLSCLFQFRIFLCQNVNLQAFEFRFLLSRKSILYRKLQLMCARLLCLENEEKNKLTL